MHKSYSNGDVTVYWKPELCEHSGICLVKLPKVFCASRRPWIDVSGAPTDKIIEAVERCPSGALSYGRDK